MIPFLDLGAAAAELGEELEAAALRVIRGGWYIGGEALERFEAEFANYCEAAHCVGTANGLEALVLALRALDVGPGDEVIVPSHTFIASWLAVSEVGASIVPIELNEGDYTLDVSQLESLITPRTKAVMPVHIYGHPAELDEVLKVAKAHKLTVIEDAAQAHGARYGGQRIGAHGDVVCWSFYPGKNLGALGDGGAVTTNDAALADRIRCLGNYGASEKYRNELRGINSRLDPLQAAMLSVKLKHLDAWNDRRRALAAFYVKELAGTDLILPCVAEGVESVWHLFVVRSNHRDALQQHLAAAGVQTNIHYPIAPHQQGAYADMQLTNADLPIAAQLADQVLSLPIGPQLSMAQAEQIVAAVKAFG